MNKTSKIGTLIKEHRRQKGITQAGLAELLVERGFPYTETAITTWETGRAAVPVGLVKDDIAFVDVLANILDIPSYDLLKAAGVMRDGDKQLDPDAMQLAALIQNMPPAQKQAIRQMVLAFANSSGA